MAKPIQILLIEDNPGDVRLLQEYLADSGLAFKLHHSETLAGGRKILYQQPIDVILLDLQLPDSMGFPTFENLHKEFPAKPFIVLTVLSDESLGLRAVKKGAQDFLDKNELDGQVLKRGIDYAIERKQLMRRLEEAQQLAKVGNWELDLKTNQLSCSVQLRDIFERVQPFGTLEDYLYAIPQQDQETVIKVLRESFTSGDAFQVDHQIKTPGGGIKYVFLRGKIDMLNGQACKLIATTQDITQRVEMEQLRQEKELATKSAKLRQDFLARTSHEIRTPLNPILTLTKMLL
ncbi:MAG: response regulator, partial [Bacteroidota bacterium]